MGQKASHAIPIGTLEAEGVVGFKQGSVVDNVWLQLFADGSMFLHFTRDSSSPVRFRINISTMLYAQLDSHHVMIGKKGTLDAIHLVFVDLSFRCHFLNAAAACGCHDFTAEHFKMIATNPNAAMPQHQLHPDSNSIPKARVFCGGCGKQIGPIQTFCSKCGHDKRKDL